MRATRPVSAVAATIILGAFHSFPGSGPSPLGATPLGGRAGATPPADACALLTQTEVSGVLGVAVESGRHKVDTNPLYCVWAEPGADANAVKKVELTLSTPTTFEQGKTTASGDVETPLSGVGDDAYYFTPSGYGTSLHVKKGGNAVEIKVGGRNLRMAQKKLLEKTLAGLVLAKL